MRETTVKQVRGVRSDEYQTAFVEALKAVDYEKEYQQALRDIAETVLDIEFDDNNEVKPSNTDVQ